MYQGFGWFPAGCHVFYLSFRQVDMLHDKSQSYDFFSICKAQLRVFVEKMDPNDQWDFQEAPIMGPPYGKLPILFTYHSHFRIPKDMGMVWVPLTIFGGPMSLGVPRISLEMKGFSQGVAPGVALGELSSPLLPKYNHQHYTSKYLKVKKKGLPIPKGRLVKGTLKPICRDCAIYFSITVQAYHLEDHPS